MDRMSLNPANQVDCTRRGKEVNATPFSLAVLRVMPALVWMIGFLGMVRFGAMTWFHSSSIQRQKGRTPTGHMDKP